MEFGKTNLNAISFLFFNILQNMQVLKASLFLNGVRTHGKSISVLFPMNVSDQM